MAGSEVTQLRMLWSFNTILFASDGLLQKHQNCENGAKLLRNGLWGKDFNICVSFGGVKGQVDNMCCSSSPRGAVFCEDKVDILLLLGQLRTRLVPSSHRYYRCSLANTQKTEKEKLKRCNYSF